MVLLEQKQSKRKAKQEQNKSKTDRGFKGAKTRLKAGEKDLVFFLFQGIYRQLA